MQEKGKCSLRPKKAIATCLMSTSYRVSAKAYFKIFFHAAKHPHKAVNGVLVGNKQGSTVVIDDAIPLLHHWTSLSPMMEIGLDLVSVTPSLISILPCSRTRTPTKAGQYAGSIGSKLVGYYQASERLDDTTLVPVGEKVAGKVQSGFSDAITFVVRHATQPLLLGASDTAVCVQRSMVTNWGLIKLL